MFDFPVCHYHDDTTGIVRCDPFEGCVDFGRAVFFFLAGDRKARMKLIARSVETGYFIPPNYAHLQLLFDDPGFAIVVQKQQAFES